MCKCEYKLALCGTCDDVIVYNICFLIQFYGEQRLGVGAIPTVGNNYTVNVEPSCTQSDKLSPVEMGHCTLLISSFNLRAFTSGTTTSVCTLPTPSLPVDSTSLHSGEFGDRQHQFFMFTDVISSCISCRGGTTFIISSQSYSTWNWCTSIHSCASDHYCSSDGSTNYGSDCDHSSIAHLDGVSQSLTIKYNTM